MSTLTSRPDDPMDVDESNQPRRPASGRTSQRARSAGLFTLPLLAVAGIWQALVDVHVLSSTLTPAPTEIGSRLVELATADGHYLLWDSLGASASRVLPALAIAAVLGVGIGIA